MKDKLSDQLRLGVDLGDVSDDSYVDKEISSSDEASAYSDDESYDSFERHWIGEHGDDSGSFDSQDERDLSKYLSMLRGKVPKLAKKIRSNKKGMKKILKRRKEAQGMKDKLSDQLRLGVDLGDVSDDSYVDKEISSSENEKFNLSGDDEDTDNEGHWIGEHGDDSDTGSDSNSDTGEKLSKYVGTLKANALNDGYVDDDVGDKFFLSSDDDENDNSGSENSEEIVSSNRNIEKRKKYVQMMQRHTPALAPNIRSQKPGLKNILNRRRQSIMAKTQKKDKNSQRDMKSQDDVIHESESSDSDHEDVVVKGVIGSPTSAAERRMSVAQRRMSVSPRRMSVARRAVSDVFTKPKHRGTLAKHVHDKRDVIQKVGLKRRAQGIEDKFVLSTEARRASILANQARARSKLQKRIEQRKSTTANNETKIASSDVNTKEDALIPLQTVSELDEDDTFLEEAVVVNKTTQSPRPIKKLSSFEVFNEKKEMMKNYAAHQTLHDQSRETQRQGAKAALQARINRKKKQKKENA